MITALRYLPMLTVLVAVSVFISLEPELLLTLEIRWPYFVCSSILLYIFFWSRAITWWQFLNWLHIDINFKQATISLFITILTKYLPGKVWPLLTTAAYIKPSNREPRFLDSLANIGWYQLIIVISGTCIGSIGILAILNFHPLYYAVPIAVMFAIGAFIQNAWFSRIVFSRFTHKLNLSESQANVHTIRLLSLCTVHWLLMASAYWLVFMAVDIHLRPAIILTQSLANVAGILTPFAPAGLGIREVAGAGYITTQLADSGSALIYASLARFWSFCIEIVVFLTGCFLKQLSASSTPY